MNQRRDRPDTAEEAKRLQAAGVRYGYRQQRKQAKLVALSKAKHGRSA